MSVVIAMNTVVMAFELDVAWSGWVWIEGAFLAVYSFELIVKMKHAGWRYWVDLDNVFWNYLDFIIVAAGVLDMCIMPLFRFLSTEMLGDDGDAHDSHDGGGSFGHLVRMVRIVRVLRLVRLVKSVKPLYLLLSCVVESLRAMQWVLLLTMLILYGFAIFWTGLIGKGLIYPDQEVPEAVSDAFGAVWSSLFSLFSIDEWRHQHRRLGVQHGGRQVARRGVRRPGKLGDPCHSDFRCQRQHDRLLHED